MRSIVSNRRSPQPRRGTASVEVVMSAGVMLPLAGALFFLGIRMCSTVYQAIGGLVAWPFL